MHLDEIQFSGYKAFPPKLDDEDGRAQRLVIAPLTLILGKNNIGKSAVVRLPRLLLGALAGESAALIPTRVRGLSFGRQPTELLHGHSRLVRPTFGLRARLEGQRLDLALTAAQRGRDVNEPLSCLSWRMTAPRLLAETPESFRGLLPAESGWDAWREGAARSLDAMIHLGPLRAAIASIHGTGEPGPLGVDGAGAPLWLSQDQGLAEAVADWFGSHLDGWRLQVLSSGSAFELWLRKSNVMRANIAESAQGFHQVLPVVTHQLMRQRSKDGPFLDIVEQPELHLHSAAQASLADLFIETARTGRGQTLVETHSEQILLRIQRRIAEGSLTPSEVAIYFVDEDPDPMVEGSRLRRIPLHEDGELEWWPAGVFEEDFREVVAIRKAQRAREAKG